MTLAEIRELLASGRAIQFRAVGIAGPVWLDEQPNDPANFSQARECYRLKPAVKTGWVVILDRLGSATFTQCSHVFHSKEDAEAWGAVEWENRKFPIVPISWEDPT